MPSFSGDRTVSDAARREVRKREKKMAAGTAVEGLGMRIGAMEGSGEMVVEEFKVILSGGFPLIMDCF